MLGISFVKFCVAGSSIVPNTSKLIAANNSKYKFICSVYMIAQYYCQVYSVVNELYLDIFDKI